MYFSQPVLFEIPVLPRIKKYISVKLQDEARRPQPMLVSAEGQGAGLMLWAMAQSAKVMLATGWRHRKGGASRPYPGRIMAPVAMSECIGVGISEFHQTRHQHLLNYAELLVFSEFVDYIILNEMVIHCQAEPGTAPMVRIKQFVDRYDFTEEELSEGACKQTYLRYRQGKSSFNFSRHIGELTHFQSQLAA